MDEVISADVLVIGGGLGALAAIEAGRHQQRVVLVDKGILGRSGSTPTSGGYPHLLLPPDLGGDPRDSEATFIDDVIRGGSYLGNPAVAEHVAREGVSRFIELHEIGVPFEKTPEGKFVVRKSLGETYPKGCPVRGSAGALMGVLRREIFHRGVTVIENVMVTRLFCREGRIAGAFGLCQRTGRRYLFRAKAIVLAAGSATGLYLSYSASFLTTGDGYALAYDLGLPLQHLEFQEFTVIPVPRGRPIATGGIKPVTSAGAKFFNAQGERFMERYDPQRMELTARAIMVQAVAREVREGRGAFVDATSCKPTYFLKKVERLGVDWRRERVPIRPAVHTFLGGLIVDATGQTTVPGLYSYGENGGHGHLYGADRITGAVGAGFVLGYRAARQATLFAREHPPLEPAREDVAREEACIQAFGRDDLGPHALNPAEVTLQLRRTAEEHLFVYREEHGLRQALGVFQEARHEKANRVRARSLPELVRCLEVRHLALTGELVARASLARRESRGQFQRVDYPQTEDRRTRIVLRDGGDEEPTLEVQKIA